MKITRHFNAAIIIGALGLVSASKTANAAAWNTCNGSPVIWRSHIAINRNRCSIADTGVVNSAYWNGLRNWNNLIGIVTTFLVNPATDCVVDHGDGQNEVARSNRSDIDGNNGLTILQLGLCFIGSNDI